jgi:hypothetical protein
MPLRHAARSLGLRHNALRRRVDVVEAWILVAFLVALAVGCPLLGVYTGSRTYATGVREARTAAQGLQQVDAVLLEDTTNYTPAANFSTTTDQIAVKARWTGPDAIVHEARVTPTERGRAGTVVPVWIDAGGNAVDPPASAEQVIERSVGIGTSVVLGLATLLAALWLFARHAMHRRRMDYWHRGWAAIEPQWSGRRRTG